VHIEDMRSGITLMTIVGLMRTKRRKTEKRTTFLERADTGGVIRAGTILSPFLNRGQVDPVVCRLDFIRERDR
jgi:hypothetical protein